MAVYRKSYTRYDGRLTPGWARFLVITRYAGEDVGRSRFLNFYFASSFLTPLIYAIIIYLHHNLSAIELIKIDVSKLVPIDARFFLFYLGFQSMLAFFLNAFIGPGMVSPDLANNALPLYLCRPLTRKEYVFGKLTLLVGLLSAMTWIPGVMLFGLQAYLDGGTWGSDNLRILWGLFFGSMIWILLNALMALALSAWVKWKPVAAGLLFGAFFVLSGIGAAINEVMRTKWGHLLNISHLMGSVWISLFEEPMRRGAGAVFFRVARGEEIPIWCCWTSLTLMCLICVYMLARKIRGMEVVR